jgi:hypothetical protein
MMRFPPADMDAAAAAKAKRDLERLMRASAGWDKAGKPGRFYLTWTRTSLYDLAPLRA